MADVPFDTGILPKKQRELSVVLGGQARMKQFYLAGGTGLALQLGHRRSVDFDFFSARPFRAVSLIRNMQVLGRFELHAESGDTVHCAVNGVRVSFFEYPFPLLEGTLSFNGLRVASILDIALMKMNAVSGRGSKKDFIDLYFIFREMPPARIFDRYNDKFGKGSGNRYHLLKSLTYFADADKQPMPKMTELLDWEAVKKAVVKEVKAFHSLNTRIEMVRGRIGETWKWE